MILAPHLRYVEHKLYDETFCFNFFFVLLFSCSSASQLSGIEGEEEPNSSRVPTYKVGMLGASGVGKTALTAQFTTSDYICAYDASLGKFKKNINFKFYFSFNF